MQIITTDTGQIKVGDTVLPGNFESLEITASAKMDEVEIKGKKEKVTQAVGYDNARLRLNIVLLPLADGGDCLDQVRTFQSIFRKSPDQEKPGVYRFVNKHAQARGINEVIFNDLKTFEDNKSDKMLLICEFIEHVAVQVKVASKSSGSAVTKAKSTKPKKVSYGDLKMQEYSKPSYADFKRLEMEDKTAATPAQDNRNPVKGLGLIDWLRGKDLESA